MKEISEKNAQYSIRKKKGKDDVISIVHGDDPISMTAKESERVEQTATEHTAIDETKRNCLQKYNIFECLLARSWRFFKLGTRENRTLQLIGMFVFCQLIGCMIYFIICLKYTHSPSKMGTYVSIAVQLVNCSMILSPFLRIVFLLALTNLATSKLRAILLILIVIWSLQGPAMNVVSNVQLAAGGVTCMQQRIKALAEELKQSANTKLRHVPIQKIEAYLKRSMKPFVELREILRKLDDSVSRMLAWQRTLILRIRNILKECTLLAQAPYRACSSMLDELHAKCSDNMFETLCEPIKLLKYVCVPAKLLELQCEWPKTLKNQIEEGVDHIVKESKRKALETARETVFYDIYIQGKNVKDQIKSLELNVHHNFTIEQQLNFRLKEFRQELKKEVSGFEAFVDAVTLILDLLGIPILLLPFIWAVIYVIRYARNYEADNFYIIDDIERIDEERKQLGLPTILPLKEAENKKFIHGCTMRIMDREKLSLTISLAFTILGAAVPVTFILADICTYHVLDQGYKFFHSDLTRLPRPNMYQLKVTGDGFLAELLSNLLETFKPLSADTEKRDKLWRECFVEPTPPNYKLYILILCLYAICITLCIVQIYMKRLRHLIAAYFFPKRTRMRATYLYTSILESRERTTLADLERELEVEAQGTQPEKSQYYHSSSSDSE